MKTQLHKAAVAVLWVLGATGVGWTETADQIVQRAVETDARHDELLKEYQYHQDLLSKRLGDGETVKEVMELDMVVRPQHENGFTILHGTKNGQPMPASETAKLEKRAKESEMFKKNFSLSNLADRFNKQLLGEEAVHGQRAYIIGFSPKLDQPVHARLEKILNNLQGRIWISADDYGILKTEATLVGEVRLAWFFATVRQMHFYYESQPVDGFHGPAVFNLEYDVDFVVGMIRDRQHITMSDFKKVGP